MDFVPYVESLALKDLGFDEKCFGFHVDEGNRVEPNYPSEGINRAPLFQQAFRWFWEKHGKFVDFFIDDDKTFGYMISYFVPEGRADMPIQYKLNSPEEAQLAALRKLIEIVKNKN